MNSNPAQHKSLVCVLACITVLLVVLPVDGVAAEPSLNQPDGIHPNAEGVARIVEGFREGATNVLRPRTVAEAVFFFLDLEVYFIFAGPGLMPG